MIVATTSIGRIEASSRNGVLAPRTCRIATFTHDGVSSLSLILHWSDRHLTTSDRSLITLRDPARVSRAPRLWPCIPIGNSLAEDRDPPRLLRLVRCATLYHLSPSTSMAVRRLAPTLLALALCSASVLPSAVAQTVYGGGGEGWDGWSTVVSTPLPPPGSKEGCKPPQFCKHIVQ